jgi:hypothetical protein
VIASHLRSVNVDFIFVPAAQVFAETPPTKLSIINDAILVAMRA